ncbi:DUF4124 domain-containing protein [Oxalicibacterium solurbis]|uniref:DUF4124 domain-containing protein n=1 Tax=Oxalicibacterium solurbis TaxID=69280 RepID=A0A8J3B3J2_9BURK|nr:DUF4124 domain-containing protein [Oxalicibacterium solurbis]GGI54330.1 hypothetical protein GCM10011430_15040 [Oxalicibacterium solurbis]
MKRQFAFLLCSIIVLPVFAQSDVYLCIDANGNKEYKNTGSTARCKKVDLPPMTTLPAPAKSAAPASRSTPSAPPDFPRVDDSVQKARDNERRQILQDELRKEEKKLADIRGEYNNGQPERLGSERNYAKYQERTATLKDNLARTEKNVEALKRELNNLK